MGRNFWIILAVVIVASIGLIFLVNSDGDNSASKQEVLTVSETDHVKGTADTGVVLYEYSDFQCPSCAAVFPVVTQVVDEFQDQIQFVFRHFPLPSIHPNAMAAHRAAEASGNQGKFWEMHDLLYERQRSWAAVSNPSALFEGYATELNLDIDQFKQDSISEEVSKIINNSVDDGLSVGVSGTPSFFINDEQIDIPTSLDEFRTVIQEAIDSNSNP